MTYTATEFAPGRWHVIDEKGIPIYDGTPYGKDRPRVFHDEDKAVACAEWMTLEEEVPK